MTTNQKLALGAGAVLLLLILFNIKKGMPAPSSTLEGDGATSGGGSTGAPDSSTGGSFTDDTEQPIVQTTSPNIGNNFANTPTTGGSTGTSTTVSEPIVYGGVKPIKSIDITSLETMYPVETYTAPTRTTAGGGGESLPLEYSTGVTRTGTRQTMLIDSNQLTSFF